MSYPEQFRTSPGEHPRKLSRKPAKNYFCIQDVTDSMKKKHMYVFDLKCVMT